MVELSSIIALAAPIGDGRGLDVVGPGSGGGEVDACTGVKGRKIPIEPITVEARK